MEDILGQLQNPIVNDRFGEELTLEDILTDEEKAEDKFLTSKPGENFGPELTLEEVIEILQRTSPPLYSGFWEKNDKIVKEALHNLDVTIEIGDYVFQIEYFARIKSVQKFDFNIPFAYQQFYSNGKGHDDSEGVDRGPSSTGSSSDTDV